MIAAAVGPAEGARRHLLEIAYECLCTVAHLREEDLPGIRETVVDNLLVNVSRPHRGRLGFFAADCWELDSHPMSEINFSTNSIVGIVGVPQAEDVLDTLLHEAAHAHAYYNGIKDVSNRGRYHNRRFGEIAIALGLNVVRVQDARGHATVGISPRFRDEYAPLITQLEKALVLGSRVQSAGPLGAEGVDHSAGNATDEPGDSSTQADAKYVFASCNCQLGHGRPRTIRVAAGSWIAGTVLCSICNRSFATDRPESLTIDGQSLAVRPPVATHVGFVASTGHATKEKKS